uniref:LITAF domain-containing protein n=1 Tax=Poecilia reticulata TaxID=8081 RepID=A0A3P9PRH8_POERE
MEDKGVFLHTFRTVPSRTDSVESEPSWPAGPDQENRAGPTGLAAVEFRIQQLHSRRLLLLKMQRCTKRDEQNRTGTAEELISEDEDEDDELQAVQKELQELQARKEELERDGVTFTASADGDRPAQRPSYKETPRGGIYMLPPPPGGEGAAADGATDDVLPAERLGMAAGLTQCPSCGELVVTETRSTVSESMWLLCFLCSMMGCLAGCCLLPFHMKRLRNVHHTCPLCRGQIHTYKLL